MLAMNASVKPYVRIRMLGHALIAIKSRMKEAGSTRTCSTLALLVGASNARGPVHAETVRSPRTFVGNVPLVTRSGSMSSAFLAYMAVATFVEGNGMVLRLLSAYSTRRLKLKLRPISQRARVKSTKGVRG